MPSRRPPSPRLRRRPAGAALAFGMLLAGCAPPEADAPLSERAAAAPPPALIPTARFDAPLAAGSEASARLADETEALAARAEALRTRGAALSDAGVITPDARDRLEAAPGPPP